MIDPNSTEMISLFERFEHDMTHPQANLPMEKKLEQLLDNGWHHRNLKRETALKEGVRTLQNPMLQRRVSANMEIMEQSPEYSWAWVFVYEKSWRPDTDCPKLPTVD